MPQPYVALQVEGVIRRGLTGSPLESGKRLYHSLAHMYQLVLVTEQTDHEHIKGWLGMEGMSKHAHLVYGDTPIPPRFSRWLGVAHLLKVVYGYNVEYHVLCDPDEARPLIEKGYNVMLAHNAAYADSSWRPDTKAGVVPWESMATEIVAQRLSRAADKRMDEDNLS